jgi:hydroxyacylglutathione hydrolase
VFEVHQLPVLNDNYIYIIHEPISQSTAVVDPAISIPVLEFLKQKNWKLDFILNTHHHHDHTGANLDLKSRYPNCKILGSHSDHTRIPGIDILLKEDDVITLGRDTLSVLETPGHTLGHICFYASNQKLLFCGDTLFSLGCGKLFEGTAEQM